MAPKGDAAAAKAALEVKSDRNKWKELTGEYLKSMVYGGMDGIITTFAIVCAVCGANMGPRTVISMGVASLVADAFSMGMGDYLSEKAEQDFAVVEHKRVVAETRSTPEEGKEKLVASYKEKGLSDKDAATIVETMAKYEEVFVDQMMISDLEMMPPDDDDSAASKGIVTFISFMVFGSVPLLAFFIKEKMGLDGSPLVSSTVASGCTMFSLGMIKGNLTSQNMFYAGFVMALQGLFASYVAFLIGYVLDPDGADGAEAVVGKAFEAVTEGLVGKGGDL